MKAEYTKEDFANAVKNPYFHKLNTVTEVAVRKEDYALFAEIAEKNGVKPEIIMRRCLEIYATKLREDED